MLLFVLSCTLSLSLCTFLTHKIHAIDNSKYEVYNWQGVLEYSADSFKELEEYLSGQNTMGQRAFIKDGFVKLCSFYVVLSQVNNYLNIIDMIYAAVDYAKGKGVMWIRNNTKYVIAN